MSLCMKEWEKRVVKKVGKEWWNLKPMQRPHNVRTYLNQFTSTIHEWKGKWEGFMQQFSIKGKPIQRVTQVQFALLGLFMKHLPKINTVGEYCTHIQELHNTVSALLTDPAKADA
ncbi:uncharacterized protein ACA1_076460 [Acanthamoeba castellanii str. Neff]|uniref:Uncharacterized protein n=1 Tax=Acanthamoeba castellanii (strain ATCC 30010 / Neff) TaxID=1257118 RepID=L8GM20_ACACF|nr:uncharacterized protein ACA1_076460 [Acanthamoeba castellanii str. Neff]ELR13793.1 hypothetical protein ACA1_076460 [Acanthamoeba castellanii str. Neff]